MTYTFLVDLLILLGAAVVIVPLFQAARLGAVPGFLVAGVIVGPSGLALIDTANEIVHLAEIGVVLLLFVIGIELKPSRLWLMRRQVFGLGSAQVLLTGVVLAVAAHLFFALPARVSVLLGAALALSSTAFVLQLLVEHKALNSPHGRASFSILLLQDLAVVPLLALVPLVADPKVGNSGEIALALVESVAVLALVLASGRYLLHPLLHRVARAGSPEVLTASALLIVLGGAMATDAAGLSMAMGAFLAGLLMSESAYRHQVMAEIQPFRGLLIGLFFMSMGMMLDLDHLLQGPLGVFGLLAVLLGIKAITLFALARLFGLQSAPAMAVSLLLAQSGEFTLIVLSLARQSDLLDPQTFQDLLLVVLLSMLVTPLLARLARRLTADRPEARPQDEPTAAEAPVVIAGYGRVGHRIGEILSQAGQHFVAFDSNPVIAASERARGNPVYYGDVSQPGLLRTVGAADAQLVIVTLNDPESTKRLVTSLREQYPNVQVLARGHNLETCQSLSRMGAAGVVSENVEASLELSRMALERVGLEAARREDLLSAFRERYHAQIHEPPERDTQARHPDPGRE